MKRNKTFLNWSSGKDSVLALHRLEKREEGSLTTLLTTLNAENSRVSMHGVALPLLQQQAALLGKELEIMELSPGLSLPGYNAKMARRLEALKAQGFTSGAFGDILLDDLKDYRTQHYQKAGLKPLFPLWKENTHALLREFIDLGYRAVVVCVNAQQLDRSFCGRMVDRNFLRDLPNEVDPCGENGEFHTFVFDGPLFARPIEFDIGEIVMRDYKPGKEEKEDCFTDTRTWDTKFWFADLIPAS